MTVLVVGAGEVGRRRVDVLLRAGASVRWVAPDLAALSSAYAAARLVSRASRFEVADLEGCGLVLACATPEVNDVVAAAAKAAGVLCGRADAPERSDFVVPAQADRGGALLSLSSGGAGPSAARTLLAALLSSWRPAFDDFLTLWAEARTQVAAGPARRAAARGVANDEILSMLDAGDIDGARARLRAALGPSRTDPV
ncbi:MAG: precorrin-2 dehydrogenase/sirohydrochlorin ferrochelatase family protein [Bradymonadia bacterium]